MECQIIIEMLSPYLDGELEPSETKFVVEHLEHCHRCRNELLALQEISFVLQELPEITPPPDFHAGLQSKLTRLTTAAAAETVKQKVSPIYNFVNGTWSKVAAYAAVLILAFGTTALWYPEGLGIKTKPDQESYNVLSEIPQSRQSVPKETVTLENKNSIEPDSSNIIQDFDSIQFGAKNKPDVNQKESSQTNNTPAYEEKKIIASELTRETGAMIIRSKSGKGGIEDIPEVNSPEVARAKDPDLYDQAVPLGAGMGPVITTHKTKETGQGEQFLGQGQDVPKFMKMHLDVEEIENAIAEILILSQNNDASVEVLQNKVLIYVPAENFEPLAKQIGSLGQVTVKEFIEQEFIDQEFTEDFTEQDLNDEELNAEQNSLEHQIFIISLELE